MAELNKMSMFIKHLGEGMKNYGISVELDSKSKSLLLIDRKTNKISKVNIDMLNQSIFGKNI